ncbi:SHOCT domain-containing protein [Streptomyces sp. NPDC093600]|uniref:SHOCT domain-containing protein n=1 Tax=Streptomyces sp. NPDC093600 TaxID=3366047 RepID=UPI0038173994
MDDYPLLNLFLTMLEFFLFVVWFFLLFKIITDIFRSHDLGGWGKAGWSVLIIVLPFLGVFIYLIARGKGMASRDVEQARAADAAFKAYIKDAAATPGSNGVTDNHVEDLAKLVDLRAQGAITEVEFQKAKDKLLA